MPFKRYLNSVELLNLTKDKELTDSNITIIDIEMFDISVVSLVSKSNI